MVPVEKRWAEPAFSNLFQFYNQIAIILPSHKLSTFSPHPQLRANILKNRTKRCRDFHHEPSKYLKPQKRRQRDRWDRELESWNDWDMRKIMTYFLSPWGEVPQMLIPGSSQLGLTSCSQIWPTLMSLRQVLQTIAWAPSPRISDSWVRLCHRYAFKTPQEILMGREGWEPLT